MENKKVLLSIEDLHVKFRVRGRQLTAIRGISLDIYENESIAIVGESGSGKSVFTKTFAGMLDQNGYISKGKIVFSDEELSDTKVKIDSTAKNMMSRALNQLNEYSKLEFGAETHKAILELESEKRQRGCLTDEENAAFDKEKKELSLKKADVYNYRSTLDHKKEKEQIKAASKEYDELEAKERELEKRRKAAAKAKAQATHNDASYMKTYDEKMAALKAKYAEEIKNTVSADTIARNEILAKEIYLSIGRYDKKRRIRLFGRMMKSFKKAMELGVDFSNEEARNAVFDSAAFRVRYIDETAEELHGSCIINLANVKYEKDWTQIRGGKIATVFQDPMTSLNPIITIGKQITSIIKKHQDCTDVEARARALDLMRKVGIPKPEARFDDYPFQYSGGMRQRIVIAIALSCQPKILICDEPTTALDVTIQAQILKLIKDLQREFNYTIVFITHDLGVVANIADRVAVMYGGQIIELGTVEEVFYEPAHPYTWALLSSLPQIADRNTKLYSITGTPPSLYNQIVGDAFAPRNPYCLKIDTLLEPPMFKISDTHYAKTWLLDPKAPKIEKPQQIHNIHEKLIKAFNI